MNNMFTFDMQLFAEAVGLYEGPLPWSLRELQAVWRVWLLLWLGIFSFRVRGLQGLFWFLRSPSSCLSPAWTFFPRPPKAPSFHLTSFLLGLASGFFLWPILDLALLLRLLFSRSVRRAVRVQPAELDRVLE